jgi:NitT/TauT family transport system substrate-binding protein
MDDRPESAATGPARRKRLCLFGALVVLGALGAALIVDFSRRRTPPPPPVREVRVALAVQPSSALLFIALDRGFFDEERLKVHVREYASGKRAMVGLFEGEADLASTADVPIVFSAFERSDFRIVATICQTDNVPRIVARRDRGIETPADLAGKRIATQRASAVHFFMDIFLLSHQIPQDKITVSFMKAEELPKALAEGRIDAFSMREPYVSEARRLLGDKVVVFEKPGLYYRTENVVGMDAFLQGNADTVTRVIRGLVRAEEFAREQPDAAAAILAARLGVSKERARVLWRELNVHVGLDQVLMVSLDDEARWALRKEHVTADESPNFLDYVWFRGMSAVDPARISIVRHGAGK